jgi:hypothetical protein
LSFFHICQFNAIADICKVVAPALATPYQSCSRLFPGNADRAYPSAHVTSLERSEWRSSATPALYRGRVGAQATDRPARRCSDPAGRSAWAQGALAAPQFRPRQCDPDSAR